MIGQLVKWLDTRSASAFANDVQTAHWLRIDKELPRESANQGPRPGAKIAHHALHVTDQVVNIYMNMRSVYHGSNRHCSVRGRATVVTGQ